MMFTIVIYVAVVVHGVNISLIIIIHNPEAPVSIKCIISRMTFFTGNMKIPVLNTVIRFHPSIRIKPRQNECSAPKRDVDGGYVHSTFCNLVEIRVL